MFRSNVAGLSRSAAANSLPRLVTPSILHPSIRPASSMATSETQDKSPEILREIAQYRKWRKRVRRESIIEHFQSSAQRPAQHDEDDPDSVGFVPTMGALHAGHLDLVRHSLRENRHTVVSIFVNPAQFSPTEDLDSYPRTLGSDLEALRRLEKEEASTGKAIGTLSAVFCPNVKEMYPPLPGTNNPFSQHIDQQQGAFVEVKGLSNVLEGKSRPGFFRGVATVVTKLWHVVEPTRVYFGQKDIQQAIILRALLTSLLFQFPSSLSTQSTFRLIETTRDAKTGLALSSRNAYLSSEAMQWAPTLYNALDTGRAIFDEQRQDPTSVTKALSQAEQVILDASKQVTEATQGRVKIELDYISINSIDTLEAMTADRHLDTGAVISGAMAITEGNRRTRLIDNLLLGSAKTLVSDREY